MSGGGSSCPVCYEQFLDDDENTHPRRLNCSCIICSSCISSELIDEVFYCPECGSELKGKNIDEISSLLDVSDVISKTSDDPVSDDEAITSSSSNLIKPGHLRTFSSDGNDINGSGTGSLSARFSLSSGRNSLSRNPCKEPGCDKKAFTNGYCLKHSKSISKRVVEVEKIANEMIEQHDLRYFSTSSQNLRKSNRNSLQTTNPATLREKFKDQERIEMGDALDLIMRAKTVLSREPNVLRLDAPVIVVGDIHGQYFDLINIINEAKKAHTTNGPLPTYLFLGDYVDRGYYSCEVMLYLLSLKVAHPDRVWLLRGNHECASVSGHFGFKEECKMKYGVNIYYSFLLLFQTLPLGAIITTAFGDIYACHGGLSPSLNTIEDIEMIDRMVEPEGNLALMDIIWADPINDENVENMTAEEYQAFIEIDWRPNPTRGCSYVYGYKSVKKFLNRNNLVCLVRAHEVQEEGYRKHFAPEIMESKILVLQKQLEEKKQLGGSSSSDGGHRDMNKSISVEGLVTEDQNSADSVLDRVKSCVLEDTVSEGACTTGTAPTATSSGSGTPESQSFGSTVAEKDTHSEDDPVDTNKHDTGIHQNGPLTIDVCTARPCEELDETKAAPAVVASPTENAIFAAIDQLEDFPPVITIFSAPNYCDRYQNRGAILLIDAALDQFRLIQYDCVDHPKPEVVESQTTNLVELIIQTCPYMPLSFRNFVRLAVELGEDDDLEHEDVDENDLSIVNVSDDSSNQPVALRKPDFTSGHMENETTQSVVLNINDELANEKVAVGIAMEETKQDESYENHEEGMNAIHTSTTGLKSIDSLEKEVKSMNLHSPAPLPGTTLPPRGKSASLEGGREEAPRNEVSFSLDSMSGDYDSNEADISNMETPAPPERISPSLPYSKFKRRGSKTISLIRQSSATKSLMNNENPNAVSVAAVFALGSNSSDCSDEQDDFTSPQNRSLSASPVVHYDISDPRSLNDLETHLSPRSSINKGSFACHESQQQPVLEANILDDMKENIEHHLNYPEQHLHRELKKRKSSNVYMQALASDALNEVHPAMVNAFVQRFKNAYESSVKRKFQMSVFQLSHEEKPAISVRDLKKKFESKSMNVPNSEGRRRSYPPPKQIISDAGSYDGISKILNKFGGSQRFSVNRRKVSPKHGSSDSYHHSSSNLYHHKHGSTGHIAHRHGQQRTVEREGIIAVGDLQGVDGMNKNMPSSDHPSLHRCVSDGLYAYNATGDNRGFSSLSSSARGSTPGSLLHPGTEPSSMEEESSSIAKKKIAQRRPTMSPVPLAKANESKLQTYVDARLSAQRVISEDASKKSVNPEILETLPSLTLKSICEEPEYFGGTNLSTSSSEKTPNSGRSTSPPFDLSPTVARDNPFHEQGNDFSSNSGYSASKDVSDEDEDAIVMPTHVDTGGNMELNMLREGPKQYQHHHHHQLLSTGMHSRSESSVTSLQYDQEQNPDPTDSVLFSQTELMGLRLMFSLFDRSGQFKITYEDLVAYAEETDDAMGIRDAGAALEILDIDGDGYIGLLDFIYFARRLKKIHQVAAAESE